MSDTLRWDAASAYSGFSSRAIGVNSLLGGEPLRRNVGRPAIGRILGVNAVQRGSPEVAGDPEVATPLATGLTAGCHLINTSSLLS